MNKLSEAILKKIRKDKITPTPRWCFVALHVLLIAAFVIAIALGAMAFGLILRGMGDVDWEMVGRAGKGPIRGFFLILPYIWLAVLAVVLFLAERLFSKTKTGYRFKPLLIVLLSVGISLAIGLALYLLGAAHCVENELANRVRPYADLIEGHDRMLLAPDKGVLAGQVVDIKPNEQLMIIDFNGVNWTVDIGKVVYKKNFEPEIGRPIGMIGERIEDGIFRADKIMQLRPKNPPSFFKCTIPMPPMPPIPPMPPFKIIQDLQFEE